MSNSEAVRLALQGVDIQVAAAAFYANAPQNADVRALASHSLQSTRTRTPRPPRKDATLAPSAHRPHVMLRSLDQNTRSNYGAGLLRFTQYCDSISISKEDRMPASSDLIATFAAHHAGSASGKTLANWLAGLHYWHIVNGAEWKADDQLHHVRRGFTKMVPPSSKRAKRPPVTLEALTILFEGLDLSLPLDATVGTTSANAFWDCCRLGELLIPSLNLFDPLKHVSRAVLPLDLHQLSDGTHYCSIAIPWTKTTLQEGASISITARDHITCPLKALSLHLDVNARLPPHAPLFAYHFANDNGWLPLTKSIFMTRCNEIWERAGFPPMPGHAFRISGATELLLQGVNPDVVAQQGRWKSQAFLEYWRRIESILPLFISSSHSPIRTIALDGVMSAFAARHQLSMPANS
ncbi:hypothetical protein BJ138DRAFT_1004711 [Hygrophoropsis aurantiaca]|uniref:Uncharacterized protein n=1 Tax=Hygrophoropsis aurantiaca TaxID=72124 RepID=A0ACB8AFV1_9AGAM|nr:hypothetical protein BJ138DRAFT_1004711 [Hygrophoropsis aurantiaca]